MGSELGHHRARVRDDGCHVRTATFTARVSARSSGADGLASGTGASASLASATSTAAAACTVTTGVGSTAATAGASAAGAPTETGALSASTTGRPGSSAGWIASIVGALIVLFVYGMIAGKRS